MRSAKVMLLGAIGVGKSSLAKRLVFDRFDADYKTTIGVDILTCDIDPGEGGELMRLVLWDTDGDFGHEIFSSTYIKGAAGAVVVSDASRPGSIETMGQLVADFEALMPGRPVLAILNKTDLAPDATAPGGALRTSAMSGEGVREAFAAMARAIQRRGL